MLLIPCIKPQALATILRRYGRGQKFGQHYDDAVQVAHGETAYTVLIYLDSSGLVGGETVFYGVSVCGLP